MHEQCTDPERCLMTDLRALVGLESLLAVADWDSDTGRAFIAMVAERADGARTTAEWLLMRNRLDGESG